MQNEKESSIQWGETWGEKGYIRMMMGMDICGVADVATIPTI